MTEGLSEEQIVEGLKQKIEHDSTFAIHVFCTIWNAQQPVEKFTGQYAGSDGVGFKPHETRKWNRFYDMAEQTGWVFTPRELDDLREGMRDHARQFRNLTRPVIEARRREMEG